MDAPHPPHVLLNCPKCDRPMQVPQAGIGKRVRCPRCDTTFVAKETEPIVEEGIVADVASGPAPSAQSPAATVPRRSGERQADVTWDEEESRPYRRAGDDSGRDPEARSRSLYWILGGVFGTLLLAGIIVLVVVLSNQKEPAAQAPGPIANNPRDQFKPAPLPQDNPAKDAPDWPDKERPRPDFPPDRKADGNNDVEPKPAPGRPPFDDKLAQRLQLKDGIARLSARLDEEDPLDRNRDKPAKIYLVQLEAKRLAYVELKGEGGHLQPVLRLEDMEGREVAADRAFRGIEPARLAYMVPAAGTYRLVATTNIGPGPYTMIVRQLEQGDPLP